MLKRGGGPLEVTLGLADHPLRQRQQPWGIDFGGELGHLAIVGGRRTGRSTALRTIAASLLLTHDPTAVQLYVLDRGGSLQALAGAPHVGTVAGKADPEVARRTVRLLSRLVDQRDGELRRLGLGGIDELRRSWRERGSGDGFGDVFLLIDNWGTATRAFDWIEEEVTALAGVGLSHGIHPVLSADRWGDIRPALRDRIPARLQLRPIDPAGLGLRPPGHPGAGQHPGKDPGPGVLPDPAGAPPGRRRRPRDRPGHRLPRPGYAPRPPRRRSAPGPAPPPHRPPRQPGLGGVEAASEIPLGIGDADLRPVPLDLLAPDTQHL